MKGRINDHRSIDASQCTRSISNGNVCGTLPGEEEIGDEEGDAVDGTAADVPHEVRDHIRESDGVLRLVALDAAKGEHVEEGVELVARDGLQLQKCSVGHE